MKLKLSVTLERPLVRYLDKLPGKSRSEKLERVLQRYRRAAEEVALRRALAQHSETPQEREEAAAWRKTIEHDQWRT
jgi:hypothetical protein